MLYLFIFTHTLLCSPNIILCSPDFSKLVQTLRNSQVDVLGGSMKRQLRMTQMNDLDPDPNLDLGLLSSAAESLQQSDHQRRLHLTVLNRTLKVLWHLIVGFDQTRSMMLILYMYIHFIVCCNPTWRMVGQWKWWSMDLVREEFSKWFRQQAYRVIRGYSMQIKKNDAEVYRQVSKVDDD